MELTRDQAIRLGLIVPHPDLHDMYADGVVAPSASMPWRKDIPCLRLDDLGRKWARMDVADAVSEDYNGQPPSQAAARAWMGW